ncbi:MAG: FeoB-associated Cys-rich membrane protein [Oscillospiraceae bacterium]|jgi:hypothetical protein|nr:FeoB-associated Cys-rich membrane protein [Oscillospiraceae bacterium]
MSLADGIVIALLLAALAGIAWSSIRRRRRGGSCGSCSSCPRRGSCQKPRE